MATPYEIEIAPFPPLEWADEFWEGFAEKPPAWQMLRVESVGGLGGGETEHAVTVYRKKHIEPSAEQRAAYQAFLDRGEALVSVVLGAVHASYGPLRARWLERDPELELPEIATAADLVRMTELDTVYVHDEVKDGRAYVGIALRCAWDEEHGAGVMLHGDRVVSVGGHDDAMLAWIARDDAEGKRRNER